MRLLKGLQNVLGAYQDVDVHTGILAAHARRLSRGAARSRRQAASVSRLVKLLEERTGTLRAQLVERIAAFDAHAVLPGPDEVQLPRAAGL